MRKFNLVPGAVEFVAKDSGNTYVLTVTKKGRGVGVKCSCRGFRRWSHCKHSDAARNGERFYSSVKPVTTTTKKENAVKKSTAKKVVVIKKKPAKVTVASASGRQYTCGACGEKGHNARTCSTATTKVKPTTAKVSKTKVVKAKKTPKFTFPTNVPVNVKVKGERTMRKNVVLAPHAEKVGVVMVKTGGRGRPSNLAVENIERVRAL